MPKATENRRNVIVIAVALAAITAAAFSRVPGNDFVNYDDLRYVTHNPNVAGGLSLENLVWAFNVGYAGNWHPLTWISHMLDCTLFGMRPAGHHAVNLIFHIANVVLLFLVLNRMTKSLWRSAFVAGLFAVHPLHVESVAWVAERKDVLSAFFWILTMGAYALYAESPNARRYSAVVILFALGLMAKPMLVTLPIVLLLLDYWPLNRFASTDKKRRTSPFRRLAWEKVPLLALSAVSCAITMIAQQRGHAMSSLQAVSFDQRLANAIVSYVEYLAKMLRPVDLAVLYAYPDRGIPAWEVVGSAVLLVGLSAAAIRAGRRAPYLLVGWLWYVIALVPVIGLIQVGEQAMADRYAYIPLIGLFVIVSWGIPEIMQRFSATGRGGDGATGRTKHPHTPTLPHSHTSTALAAITVMVLSSLTWIQTGYWKNTVTLFDHALRATGESATAYANLGSAYADIKDCAKAELYLKKALDLKWDLPYTHFDYANVLYELRRDEDAVREYREAVRLKPDLAEAHRNLAFALYETGRYAEAWNEVHECRGLGVVIRADFLRSLSQEMPEPRGFAE